MTHLRIMPCVFALVILAACSGGQEPAQTANPASVYCEEHGGTLELREGSGVCVFEDGTECEEWAFYRNECQPEHPAGEAENRVKSGQMNGTGLLNNTLIGGETDGHGCFVAAGYTWCEAKQKCLRTWVEACPGRKSFTIEECEAAGGKPRNTGAGESCRGDETNIGDVTGFLSPHACCQQGST